MSKYRFPFIVILKTDETWEVFNIVTREIANVGVYRDAIAISELWASEVRGRVCDLTSEMEALIGSE